MTNITGPHAQLRLLKCSLINITLGKRGRNIQERIKERKERKKVKNKPIEKVRHDKDLKISRGH